MAHSLDIVPIRLEDKRGIVVRAISRQQARGPVVAAARPIGVAAFPTVADVERKVIGHRFFRFAPGRPDARAAAFRRRLATARLAAARFASGAPPGG